MYNKEIERRADVFIPFRHYEVTNAFVKYLDEQYRTVGTPCQWTITSRTYVEESTENENQQLDIFKFTSYPDFRSMVDSNALIDVIGQVLEVRPIRELFFATHTPIVRDIVLIDESMMPYILSLWNNYALQEGDKLATEFIIADHSLTLLATRVKVTSFEGISLSTRMTSIIMIDPPIPKALQLSDWAIENALEINNALQGFNNVAWQERTPALRQEVAVDIANVRTLAEKAVNIWVFASAKISNPIQDFYHLGCKLCGSEVKTYIGKKIKCTFCKADSVVAPWAKFNIILKDDTGTLPAVIEGKVAEKLFSFEAENLMHKINEKKAILREIINFNMTEAKLMHLKTFPGTYETRDIKRFKVHFVQDTVPDLPLVESTQKFVSSVPLLAESAEPSCLTNIELNISTSQPTFETGSSSKPATNLVIDVVKESPNEKATLDLYKPEEDQPAVLNIAFAHVKDNEQVTMLTPTTPASVAATSLGTVESLTPEEKSIKTFERKLSGKVVESGNTDVTVTCSAKRSLNFEPTFETYLKNDPPSATLSASRHSTDSGASQVDILVKTQPCVGTVSNLLKIKIEKGAELGNIPLSLKKPKFTQGNEDSTTAISKVIAPSTKDHV